ncbi:MAG: hypothetical protein Q8R91_04540 [Candidatus Omnitrophota bacterium]|nr:hypothetical protein [Candidatus Omnitrophota bacterium]
MKRVHKPIRLLMAAAAVALMAQASGRAEGPALMVSGKIASIDSQHNVLKLKTGLFATKEFVIQPDTKITDGRRSLDLEQLQPGAQATVEYMQEDGEHVAQSITVESAAAAPGAPLEPEGAVPSAPAPGALPSGPSGGQGGWQAPAPSPSPEGATSEPAPSESPEPLGTPGGETQGPEQQPQSPY